MRARTSNGRDARVRASVTRVFRPLEVLVHAVGGSRRG
jgi:hypothetical protein